MIRLKVILIIFMLCCLIPANRADYDHNKQVNGIVADTTHQSLKAGTIVVNPADNRRLIIGNNSPWLRRITYLGHSFALVNILIVFIAICILMMFCLLVIILLNRNRMEREAKLREFLLEKYQGMIIDHLFGETRAEDFIPIANDRFRRQVLIDQIIDVSVNLKGDAGARLLALYKSLNLDRDSIERAGSRKWHLKIKGFRELAFMNIKDANPKIYEALNSSNEILRMEAQIALVRLSDDNPFEFLFHLTRPFSLWEQITLHELMIQHEIKPPEFRQWLGSPNDTVVMFALRMIREFKQMEAEEELKSILSHPSRSIRLLAVQVAGDLQMRTTLQDLKHMYKNQDYNICLEIVRSIGKMPDVSMMGFLKLVLDKEDDVQLQIEATKAIENMGEEGVKALVKLMKSEYKNYNIIVRHVLDRRIY
ncbi:MAG TPA: HEAT repeat domain-containing protein [Bacteroidales bacterium]|nr:HEAT repeat domain-containing protein [Bacteroidales bacterium]